RRATRPRMRTSCMSPWPTRSSVPSTTRLRRVPWARWRTLTASMPPWCANCWCRCCRCRRPPTPPTMCTGAQRPASSSWTSHPSSWCCAGGRRGRRAGTRQPTRPSHPMPHPETHRPHWPQSARVSWSATPPWPSWIWSSTRRCTRPLSSSSGPSTRARHTSSTRTLSPLQRRATTALSRSVGSTA
ncbi:hypothetical protein H4R19_004644, partial [Coemansia spiralis]